MIIYLVAAVCAVVLVLITSRLVRRLQHGVDDSTPDGPTTAHAGSMLSALYLLAFAIAIIVPWTTADSARANTYTESQAIAEAYWAAEQLPASDAYRTQDELRAYTDLVRGPEWKLMRDKGRLRSDGWTRLDTLRREVMALQPSGDEAQGARAAVLGHLSEISAARHQREMDARTTPPPGLIIVTLLTGAAVVLLPFMSGARPHGAALIPLGLTAALLAAGSYLTLDITHVFDGALAVRPDAFTSLQTELQRISGGR